jgi:glycosyltransferase involved in cell wall biosynthesis
MSSNKNQLVSVIVPIYNELDNVAPMYRELIEAMETQPRPFELVMVDDGSRDGTTLRLKQLAADDERIKLVLFRRNYGQTAAMQAGIQNANGELLVTIDGDLQNDPRDIPMMLDNWMRVSTWYTAGAKTVRIIY